MKDVNPSSWSFSSEPPTETTAERKPDDSPAQSLESAAASGLLAQEQSAGTLRELVEIHEEELVNSFPKEFQLIKHLVDRSCCG